MKASKTPTLRQLISQVRSQRLQALLVCLCARDQQAMRNVTLQTTTALYTHVMDEMASMPKARAYQYPLVVRQTGDAGQEFPDVSLWNREAIDPPKGAKPWGGKDHPRGYYNCNDSKYQRFLGASFTPWGKLIDTPVHNPSHLPEYELLASVLWELTFYGWSDKERQGKVHKLKTQFKRVCDEVNAGHCTVLQPKRKGGYRLVIPDSLKGILVRQ